MGLVEGRFHLKILKIIERRRGISLSNSGLADRAGLMTGRWGIEMRLYRDLVERLRTQRRVRREFRVELFSWWE